MAPIPTHSVASSLQTAMQHHQAGRLKQAEDIYREVLRAQPQNADALHLLGVVAYQNGDNDLAVDMIERALAINPNAAEFHNNCGEAYRAAGKYTQAISHYERALALNPATAMTHNNLGLAYQALNMADKAARCHKQALLINPGFAAAHYNLALAYHAAGQLDDAIIHFEKALGLGYEFAAVYLSLANTLQLQGRHDEAIVGYQKALALNPDYPEALNNLGNAFHAQGRLDDAIACYVKALRLRPDYVMAHNNLANVHLAEGRLEAAIARYKKVLEIKPDFAEAYYNLGNALRELGETDEAVANYKKVLAIKPEHVDAYHNLAVILRESGRHDEAIDCLRNAVSIYQSTLGIPAGYRRSAPRPSRMATLNNYNNDATNDASMITIATSIAPKNIETQQHAIDSWRHAGFHVVSINAQDEIDTLKPSFPNTEFVLARRDARKDFGKPYIYYDDVLEYFRANDCRICGIANSDIHLLQDGFGEFVRKEASDSLLFGCRMEIPFLGATEGDVYQKGFDYFFFHRKFLDIYPEEDFCLGLPWWDYWAVLMPILNGVPVKKLVTPAGYHITHPVNWNYNYWVSLGLVIAKYIGTTEPPTTQNLNAYDKYIWTLIEASSERVALTNA